jgi:hypothetical protein
MAKPKAVENEKVEIVKCSFWCPRALWREAKIRAMDENLELQQLMAKALEDYLSVPSGPSRLGGRR